MLQPLGLDAGSNSLDFSLERPDASVLQAGLFRRDSLSLQLTLFGEPEFELPSPEGIGFESKLAVELDPPFEIELPLEVADLFPFEQLLVGASGDFVLECDSPADFEFVEPRWWGSVLAEIARHGNNLYNDLRLILLDLSAMSQSNTLQDEK